MCIVCNWQFLSGDCSRRKSNGIFPIMKNKTYTCLMKIGRSAGCHQIPERSFSYRGHPFPVCARCTGVIVGQILGGLSFPFLALTYDTIGFLCFIMFFDWWLQRMRILHSTNLRRFITGILCGFAVGNTYAGIIGVLWRIFFK